MPAMEFSECHREASSLLQSAGVSLVAPVGAGLPAMESCECHRKASSLLQSAGRRLQILWELACQRWNPANAIASQARSYKVRGVACRSCGSWLARDGILRMPSRGKLAPTKYGVSLADPVGAGLPAMGFSECHRETSSLLQSAGCRLQTRWELTCQRWSSAVAIARQARSCRVRGVACRSCESWLASDGIQRMPSRDKLAPTECGASLADPVGAGLPAMEFSGCHRETSSRLQSAGCRLQIRRELACQRWNPAVAIARQARSCRVRGVRGVACRSGGSWLARDGIQRMPSRGKLAPAECGVSLVAPVGAGLPAMGFSGCHRKASLLLQSAGCRLQILWELACQRWDSAVAIARQAHSGFNVRRRPLRYELHHVASTPDRSRSDARAGRN